MCSWENRSYCKLFWFKLTWEALKSYGKLFLFAWTALSVSLVGAIKPKAPRELLWRSSVQFSPLSLLFSGAVTWLEQFSQRAIHFSNSIAWAVLSISYGRTSVTRTIQTLRCFLEQSLLPEQPSLYAVVWHPAGNPLRPNSPIFQADLGW